MHENRIIVVLTNIGAVIGKGEGLDIVEPRLLHIGAGRAKGTLELSFNKLIGSSFCCSIIEFYVAQASKNIGAAQQCCSSIDYLIPIHAYCRRCVRCFTSLVA